MTLEEVRAQIAQMRADDKSYQYIADRYSTPQKQMNKGVIHQIHNKGHEPKDLVIRKLLGLGDETVTFIRQVKMPVRTYGCEWEKMCPGDWSDPERVFVCRGSKYSNAWVVMKMGPLGENVKKRGSFLEFEDAILFANAI